MPYPCMNVHCKPPEDSVVVAVSVELEIVSVLTTPVRVLRVTSKLVQEAAASDPVL